MSNRDLSRRLVRLEADRKSHCVHYKVSDRLLSEVDWRADMDGDLLLDDDGLRPVMTIAEWEFEFRTPASSTM